jgi:hypothetical protein
MGLNYIYMYILWSKSHTSYMCLNYSNLIKTEHRFNKCKCNESDRRKIECAEMKYYNADRREYFHGPTKWRHE